MLKRGVAHAPVQNMCRLWFVRMPKPAEDSSTAAVEAEVEGYRTQVQLLNESLTIKRVRGPWAYCLVF